MPLKFLKKMIYPVQWKNLRALQPLSRSFGFDRGTPIDRYYIEKFLNEHRHLIHGRVLEIAENTYSKEFAQAGSHFEILHVDIDHPKATIVGDLAKPDALPENVIDCFICTQTLNFIYDVKAAVRGIHRLLKPGGIVLVTVAGISQISRYDMDRWGDYWRFTTKSAFQCFVETFGESNVEVRHYGNVLTSVAFLEGLSCDELTMEELDYTDQDYQMLITIKAAKL